MLNCAARQDLRLRPLNSTFTTRADVGSTVEVDLCRRSGLEVTTITVDLCHWSRLRCDC
jgi:hypothetical protein